jgi:transcriptional regulator with XRE-family HTH domain
MSNETLRDALQEAGVTQEQLADQIQVDVRTVRRWLAGGVPHARQRASVARALDRDQTDLWPEAAGETGRPVVPPTDLIAGYPDPDHPDAPGWRNLLRDAHEHVDVLSHSLAFLITNPEATGELIAKAEQGCSVRLIIAEPSSGLAALAGRARIEIRVLSAGAPYTLHRFDHQLLLIIHTYRGPDRKPPPMFHLQRRAAGGVFDALRHNYDLLWEHHARPLDPDQDIPQPDHEERARAERGTPAAGTRRWPRQRPTS